MNERIDRYAGMNEHRAARALVVDDAVGQADAEVLDHYKPLLLGEGGAHAVFVMAPNRGDRKTVVKLHRWTTLRIIDNSITNGTPFDYMSDIEREALDRRVAGIRASIRNLRRHFGDAALPERVSIAKVPVTRQLLRAVAGPHIHGGLPIPDGTHETIALLLVQERAPKEAFGPGSFDIRNQYVEKRPIDPLMYHAFNDACLDHPNEGACADVLPMMAHDNALFFAAEHDPGLHEALRDFFTKAIHYTEETNEMLDLIGENNVRCYKDSKGAWRTVLIDTRLETGMYMRAKDAVAAVQEGTELTYSQQVVLLNAVNYVRFVNAAAAYLGIPDRLRLSDSSIADYSGDLWKGTSIIREAA